MSKLKTILAQCEAATPGPWWTGKCEPTADGHALAWIGLHFVDCVGGQKNHKEQKDDAQHIANMNPEFAAQLLRLCIQQHEALKEARQVREALIGWRQRAWPGIDQRAVIENEFPKIPEALAAFERLDKE